MQEGTFRKFVHIVTEWKVCVCARVCVCAGVFNLYRVSSVLIPSAHICTYVMNYATCISLKKELVQCIDEEFFYCLHLISLRK